jgi:hypothetical protein
MPQNDGVEDRWTVYHEWNAALASTIFGPDASGLPVFLDLDEELLQKIGVEAGGFDSNARQELLDAVRPTLNRPDHRAGVFGGHLARLMRWHLASGEPPPCIALLALLSLAAEDMHGGEGFVAHDYYNRLMPLLGVDDETEKKRVERAYRDCSQTLWGALNDWLESLGGDRGLPTAFALGNKHVGLPISQAILRATDREKLREFFEEFGLAPRSRLSPRDMDALLGEWINRTPSPASSAMQALWRRQGARDRIIEGSCALLESWDGPSFERVGELTASFGLRIAQIRLTALLRTFPMSALELNLTGPVGLQRDESLELLDAMESPIDPPLAIEPMTDSRWRLSEPERLDPQSMLDGRLRLRDNSGVIMERRPRRVVAFTKDDLMQVFFEVERLPLGEASMLLCQEDMADAVAQAFEIVARPGYSRSGNELVGLPSGWILFSDVQVLAPLPEVRPDGSDWGFALDLNVLQPLSTSQLVVEDGLRFPGHLRRWSSLAPPEVRVAVEDATEITIQINQTRAISEEVEPIDQTFTGSAAVLRLESLSLPDGDYEVLALRRMILPSASELVDQFRLRLRSANEVKPYPQHHQPLVRDLTTPNLAVVTASIASDDGWTIQGAIVQLTGQEVNSPTLVPQSIVGVPAWWGQRAAEQRGNEARSERMFVPPVVLDDCFRTGSHVMVLPTYYGTATTSSFQGYCRHCGIVKRYPSHFRFRSRVPLERRQYVPPVFSTISIESVADRAIRPDVALDALSHDRAGNARAFEQLALQIEPSQLFADRFLRGLESLGHLEVKRDFRNLSPISWEIARPALAQVREGVFVLTGFRSRRLFTALESAAGEFGFQVNSRAQVAAPDRIRISDCDLPQALVLANRILNAIDMEIEIVPEAALAIALLLPPLSAVAKSLHRSAMIGYRSINRWDERLARWARAADASAPGAYQLFGSTVTYIIRDSMDITAGTMRRGDARLVKHIASSRAGSPLVGFDSETGTLYAPLGAELPGLYSRAAVLASGLLPSDDVDQRLVAYASVTLDLAEHLAALLSD